MKKILIITIIVLLVLCGCTTHDTPQSQPSSIEEITEDAIADEPHPDQSDMAEIDSTISDWILGTEYGIESIVFDNNTFTISMPEAKRASLADYELADINEGLVNMGIAYGFDDCAVVFGDGVVIEGAPPDSTTPTEETDTATDSTTPPAIADGDTTNMIFLHHSVGENWLNDGLCHALNDQNIHVADTYYGWSDMGDRTDTGDWPDWFNDQVMPSVYTKLDTETAQNAIDAGAGENTIVMFKSCYPNSDVGMSITDEMNIYSSLLPYFAEHPERMFILVTPPPMQHISTPKRTRELTNYLVSDDGWLSSYDVGNVFVFDLYNVLTSPENHHMMVAGTPQHIVADSSNTLYYDSDGDDHPNGFGNQKAVDEFVPLFLYWYDQFGNR